MLRWGSSAPATPATAVIEEESSSGGLSLTQQRQQLQDETSSSSPEPQEPTSALLPDEDEDESDEEDELDDYGDDVPRKKARGDKRKRMREEETSGSDQVEPDEDEDEADSEDNHPIWQPQNIQSTTEFTHIISDYANKRESGCKKAEYSDITVDDRGNRWRLIIYVNGNGRASNHHLSLFLQVADADDLPFGWKKSVSYVLTLEHPNGSTYSYAKRNPDKTFKLCPKAIDWGWSQFITSDRIQQEGFVSDDSLTVRASVSVKSSSVSIDEEDSELYLKCAVEEGDADAVELCLENGASVNCQFKDDLYTPLHTACSSGSSTGSMEVLEILLERGADCNACNKWRETPLLIAANNGHRLGVASLLKHGADPSLCSEAGWSALTFAAHKGYDDIVALLLRAGAPVNSRVSEDLSTPLHKACAGSKPGHLASVKLLLDAAADVHALNKWRETPLLTAANHGQSGAVDVLLSHGADPCKCTDTGWSPLSIAAYKGHDDVVRLLLEEGAPTEEDDPTLSALLQAATKGLPETVELLLRHGADHTVTTKKGDTALSILVEQNLIDAAVEMVTRYNASIPRCSRDRKKVQRARLLINLRMKQLEKEGKLDDDDSENDGEGETTLALHVANGQNSSPPPKSKKKKKKGKNKISAEAKAKAAEEALLMELEKEEEEARKEEAEASKKQAKNRKKKERARQQKMKEEQERREKEEAEKKERERLQREKEDKERKALARQLEEAKEREMQEMLKREKSLQEKKKAKEKRDRQRQREEKQKESPPKAPAPQNHTQPASSKQARTKRSSVAPSQTTAVAPPVNGIAPRKPAEAKPAESNRRWETKAKLQPPAPAVATDEVARLKAVRSPAQSPSGLAKAPQRPRSENAAPAVETPPEETHTAVNGLKPRKMNRSLEHPSVVVFRKDKLSELLQRAVTIQTVLDLESVKKIIIRWISRAQNEIDQLADLIIPSWTDTDKTLNFFQRQFISESRRVDSDRSINMEALKAAGSAFAFLCKNIALEVQHFSEEVDRKFGHDFADMDVGLTYQPPGDASGTEFICWENYQVALSSSAMETLRNRYSGPANKMLAVFFATCIYRDTLGAITNATGMDFRLSDRTKMHLSTDLGVSAEMCSDMFSALPNNVYYGMVEELDVFYGGKRAFPKEDLSTLMAENGTSNCVLLPFETMVASNYASRMIDAVEEANARQVPVSFVVFVSNLSMHDPSRAMSRDDIRQLDTRLETMDCPLEIIPGPDHGYWSRSETLQPAPGDSMLIILQSEHGKERFAIKEKTIFNIAQTMREYVEEERQSPPPPLLAEPFRSEYNNLEPTPSASPYFLTPEYGNVFSEGNAQFATVQPGEDMPPSIPFDLGRTTSTASAPSRRGRLFDLVDNDVEEDNSVDLVAGMLDKLDVGLFQGAGTGGGSDVDIEAISLMGINTASRAPTSSSFGAPSDNPFG
mmetsp:Transcript_14160/g.39174  ORF Transcript_14160/g.39174 Transcript_14160/m.39174 type:complete len:1444 (+) Transcript_14160:147-4478(+)